MYSNLPGGKSHVVNTAWAMLALIAAGQVESPTLATFFLIIFMQSFTYLLTHVILGYLFRLSI